jgi:PPOX class probable FMN-dependent enzyme
MAIRTFHDVVTGPEELRELIGDPIELAVRAQLTALDQHCRAFIAHSPFLLLGTANSEGKGDVSPKGDPPGFVQVLDDRTLVIPDRPGNRRLDTLMNIVVNPEVGLLFLVPGMEETLRVNGRATIVRDEELLDMTMVNGKRPLLAIVVDVEQAFLHCAKAFKRSHLWDPESRVERGAIASLAQIMMDQTNPEDCTVEDLEDMIEEAYKTTLY